MKVASPLRCDGEVASAPTWGGEGAPAAKPPMAVEPEVVGSAEPPPPPPQADKNAEDASAMAAHENASFFKNSSLGLIVVKPVGRCDQSPKEHDHLPKTGVNRPKGSSLKSHPRCNFETTRLALQPASLWFGKPR